MHVSMTCIAIAIQRVHAFLDVQSIHLKSMMAIAKEEVGLQNKQKILKDWKIRREVTEKKTLQVQFVKKANE